MEKALKQIDSNCLRVVLFGPESTGKTTLSKALAEHYNTVWVPEYAREYLQHKWDTEGKICEPQDILPIAKRQIALENNYITKANKVLFCDTNLLETKVYSETYFSGHCDPAVDYHALHNTYDLYLLTYIDTPWEADDLRDKPHQREEMFTIFKSALKRYKKPYITLQGNLNSRLQHAINQINLLIKDRYDI